MAVNDTNLAIAMDMGVTNRPDATALVQLLDEEVKRSESLEGALAKAGACMDVLERRISDEKEMLKMARDHLATAEDAFTAVRSWLYTQMKENRLQSVKAADVTVYVKKSAPALRVTAEESVPEEFWKMKRSVDTTSLKKWITVNGPQEFAHLEQTEHVAIRRDA